MFSKNESSSAQSTYILTDRLPSSEIPFLLGRIVADFASPTDEYIPEDPRLALNSKTLEIVDTDFSSLFSGSKNTSVESKIGQILGISAKDGHNGQSRLKSKFVRTRTLPQHREALKALLDRFRPQILQLLKDNGGVAYMVVGVKSALDAEHGTERQFGNRTALSIGVPTGAIVTAASHGIVNLGQTADVDVNSSRARGQAVGTAATMEGEQVFAIRYRLVKLKKHFLGAKEPDVDYGNVKQGAVEAAVYSDVIEKLEEVHNNTDKNEDDDIDEVDEDDFDEDFALSEQSLRHEINKRSDIIDVAFPEWWKSISNLITEYPLIVTLQSIINLRATRNVSKK